MQKHHTVMLVMLDGWGREDPTAIAVRQARTPAFDELWRSCPHAFLRTSGRGARHIGARKN
jgi:2,3-bisphosphoglycerate-independent phosphoglycerate mutase